MQIACVIEFGMGVCACGDVNNWQKCAHVLKDVKVCCYCIVGSRALNKIHLISEVISCTNYVGHFALPENVDIVSLFFMISHISFCVIELQS